MDVAPGSCGITLSYLWEVTKERKACVWRMDEEGAQRLLPQGSHCCGSICLSPDPVPLQGLNILAVTWGRLCANYLRNIFSKVAGWQGGVTGLKPAVGSAWFPPSLPQTFAWGLLPSTPCLSHSSCLPGSLTPLPALLSVYPFSSSFSHTFPTSWPQFPPPRCCYPMFFPILTAALFLFSPPQCCPSPPAAWAPWGSRAHTACLALCPWFLCLLFRGIRAGSMGFNKIEWKESTPPCRL